jgi:hypothetical protein
VSEKRKRTLRKEKREKARKAGKRLWNKFGLKVEEAGDAEEDQDTVQEEKRKRENTTNLRS